MWLAVIALVLWVLVHAGEIRVDLEATMRLIDFVSGSTTGSWHVSDLVAGALISAVGALIVAAFTIISVVLANRNSREQLRLQLKAAAEEAARSRLFEMRRTVYLEGAEAIARANMVLGRMADLELPNTEITRIVQDTTTHLAKVQLVATPETVQAVADYLATFSESHCALWPHRWKLLGRARVIAGIEEQIRALAADRDRWLEQIKLANVQGAQTAQPQIWQGLWFQHQNAERLRTDLAKQLEALSAVQGREQLEFLEVCLSVAAPMLKVLPATMARARAELDLAGDEATFLRILTASSARQGNAARALAQNARDLLAQQAAAAAARAAPAAPAPAPPPQLPP